jgi:thymidine kinase
MQIRVLLNRKPAAGGCYGDLRLVFAMQGFGNILHLVPLAESVVKLTAVCMSCYGEASFTKRKGEELAVSALIL